MSLVARERAWRSTLLRRTIDETLASQATVGASPTWVLSNHDTPREVTRYARPQPDHLVRLTLSDLFITMRTSLWVAGAPVRLPC